MPSTKEMKSDLLERMEETHGKQTAALLYHDDNLEVRRGIVRGRRGVAIILGSRIHATRNCRSVCESSPRSFGGRVDRRDTTWELRCGLSRRSEQRNGLLNVRKSRAENLESKPCPIDLAG